MTTTAAGLAAISGCVRAAANQQTGTNQGDRACTRQNTTLIDYGHRFLLSLMQIRN
jgi:hypothetical protein